MKNEMMSWRPLVPKNSVVLLVERVIIYSSKNNSNTKYGRYARAFSPCKTYSAFVVDPYTLELYCILSFS